MTPQEYFGELLDFYAHGMDVMRAKNADYADKEDPFKNFRTSCLDLGSCRLLQLHHPS